MQILRAIESGDDLRDRWASVLNAMTHMPKRRHNSPDLKCMSIEENTEEVGCIALNKYCLPKEEWFASYGALLGIALVLKLFPDGDLVDPAVLHSE